MPVPGPSRTPAFRRLERALTRRRLMQLDPRMRLELVLLGCLIAAFLFWQVRVPLEGLVRARGPSAALGGVAPAWLVLAALGGLLVGLHHAQRLRGGKKEKGEGGSKARAGPERVIDPER